MAEEALWNAIALRYASAQVTLLDLTVLSEVGWAGEIHGESQFSIPLCSLLLDLWHQLGALFVGEGGAPISHPPFFAEGEGHAVANDHNVLFVQQVYDELSEAVNDL